MPYAEARALREHDGGKDVVLECDVCLSEFENEEQLRLLPESSHAFHPDCIGEWLAGHVTCPVCRCSLIPEEPAPATEANIADEVQRPEAVAIDVNRESDGDEEQRIMEAAELERIGSLRRAVRSRSGRPFSRAHSTGHSLSARLDGDLERFKLRLPEQLRREMISAGEESLHRVDFRRWLIRASCPPVRSAALSMGSVHTSNSSCRLGSDMLRSKSTNPFGIESSPNMVELGRPTGVDVFLSPGYAVV